MLALRICGTIIVTFLAIPMASCFGQSVAKYAENKKPEITFIIVFVVVYLALSGLGFVIYALWVL